MRTRYLLLVVPWALYQPARAQQPYPDLTIQGEEWMSGTHYHAVAQGIRSPGSPTWPMSISHASDAEFISGTQVRLTDGFHAGNFNTGHFRAHIDPALGTPPDLVVISPDPATHLQSNVLHVEKWEKLELGLRLSQEYLDAIDRFFAHYYSNGTNQFATPADLDAEHDLNPFADDSLQLVMTLVDPQGQQRMKWGFFMREAKWASNSPNAGLAEFPGAPLDPYRIRFRMAPDMEGAWSFALTLKAPYTSTLANMPLPELHYTGYAFVCDPPLEDNHGHLEVHPVNKRHLRFEDGTPFFGLGTNMADKRTGGGGIDPYRLLRKDFDMMQTTMEQLHDVGGNFMRMFLLRNLFAPEWVNLGVYSHFRTPVVCSESESSTDPGCDRGWTSGYVGNCQNQCWAFDRMLEQARANNIHIQLCIDPYPPIIAYEKFLWGAHPYWVNFLEQEVPQEPPLNRYDLKHFFYQDGDPANKNDGVFRYWKRKYKYIMARWGYSTNLAIVEPFNEIDQMLSYQDREFHDDPPAPTCQNLDALVRDRDMCRENRRVWVKDDNLPIVLDAWVSDLSDYVRGAVDPTDPVGSPLGEDKKLFLMSYTDAKKAIDPLTQQPNTAYFLPFTNPKVDLIDVHRGLYDTDHELNESFAESRAYRDNYLSNGHKKPFNRGEHNHYAYVDLDNDPTTDPKEISQFFDNYDINFHNELWASTFFGNFSAAVSWQWNRIFWWNEAVGLPLFDEVNLHYAEYPLTNVHGETNALQMGVSEIPILVRNQRVHHNFKPLSDLLANPNWQALDLFNGEFSAHKVFDVDGRIECYFLRNDGDNIAIGWVHNMYAYWGKKYYATAAVSDFLGCTDPNAQSVALPGFQPSTDYYITYFPTRMNTDVCPLDGSMTPGPERSPWIFPLHRSTGS